MKAIFSLIPYLIFKLTKLRVIVVSITIFTVLFSIYKATSLKFDGDISKMVEKKIETGKEEKQRLKTLFGNNNIIVLYIRNEATVLNTATINMLFDIANYVKGNNLFKEFHSLAQFKNLVRMEHSQPFHSFYKICPMVKLPIKLRLLKILKAILSPMIIKAPLWPLMWMRVSRMMKTMNIA